MLLTKGFSRLPRLGHQKEAGVFTTGSTLVDSLSDNPAAKLTAQEIMERIQRAELARAVAPSPAPAAAQGCPGGASVAAASA